ncbi:MAG: polysaccharide pyruvyl transferase family protein [Cyanobacteria bacterium J06638_7]
MTIAVAGVTGFRNRGVEALALPILTFLRQRTPAQAVTLLTWTPEVDQQRISWPDLTLQPTAFRRFSAPTPPPSSQTRLRLAIKALLRRSPERPSEPGLIDPALARQLRGHRVLIVTGGDVYSSEYGHDSLLYYLSLIHTAAREGLIVVLLGHTVGRFHDPAQEQAWRSAVAHVSLLTTRDRLTYDYLQQIGGLARRTEICADVAFALPAAHSVPRQGFSDPHRPLLALALSAGLHRWSTISAVQHQAGWRHLLEVAVERWGLNVLLIPHVQETYGDDRSLATALHRATGFHPAVAVAAEDLSAAEYKRLIAGCQMLVAERMHAAIAGLSSRVPTALVAYSLKARALAAMAYAGLAPGPERMVIPTDTLSQPASLESRLHDLWQTRQESQAALQRNLPHLQQLAQANFTHLEALLHGAGL